MKLKIVGVLFCTLLIGCNHKVQNEIEVPVKDILYCYQSQTDKSAYLQLQFDGERKVEGYFLVEEELYGKVFYFFVGTVSNDTTLNVDIYFPLDLISQEWYIVRTNNGIILKETFFEGMDLTHFNTIDCSEFPDIDQYISIQDTYQEEQEDSDFER